MSVDTKQALRLVSCLANPSRLAAARWGAYKLRALFRASRIRAAWRRRGGVRTNYAHCFVPRESEPPGGGEVGCEQTALIVENN